MSANQLLFLKMFYKDFATIHEIKPVLTLNKPIYVGFIVLELSKWLMYDFHYHFIKKNFDANLLFTDTDSLTYEIKSKDGVYEEFFKPKHLLDFSEYQSKFFDPTNKKVIGKMKDEYKGIPVNEFTGLKSKMYAILAENNKKSSKAKGVNIFIDFSKYKNILFKKKIIRRKMKRIQVKNIKLVHMKSSKYHYWILMLKDLF